MQIFKHGIAALSAAALVAFSGGVSAAPEITLKLGTTSSDTTSLGKGIAQVLVPKVKEYSEGRMEVAVHWSNSLCSEQICGEQARQGLVDIATSSTANFGNFGPSYAVTDLPYIFKDLDSANAWPAAGSATRSPSGRWKRPASGSTGCSRSEASAGSATTSARSRSRRT